MNEEYLCAYQQDLGGEPVIGSLVEKPHSQQGRCLCPRSSTEILDIFSLETASLRS